MTVFERRTETIKLYPAHYQSQLTELTNAALAALRDEEAAGPRRTGQKSKATTLAREHDALLEKANAEALGVTVREVSNREWEDLAEKHPPRPEDARDKVADFNLKTLPAALLRIALVTTIDLDSLSRAHYLKLEKGCWDLHNGDDDLPFVSLVSLLSQQRDSDSQQQRDTE